MKTLLALFLSLFVASAQLADFASPEWVTMLNPVAVAAAGESNPGTNNLIAWYDFADATDSHNGFDLTEVGVVSYEAGPPSYGVSNDDGTNMWSQADLDNAWATNDYDITLVARFRTYGSIANGDYILNGWNSKTYIRWLTAGMSVTVNGVSATCVAPATNVWYTIVAEYTASDDSIDVYINDLGVVESSGTFGTVLSTVFLGGSSGTSQDINTDYFGCFTGHFSASERAWIYNSGGTRVYSDFTE